MQITLQYIFSEIKQIFLVIIFVLTCHILGDLSELLENGKYSKVILKGARKVITKM